MNDGGALYRVIITVRIKSSKTEPKQMYLQLLPKGGEGWNGSDGSGRLFHACDAATGKTWSPIVNRCTDWTTSITVVDEQRRRRPSTSAVRRTLSERYGSADPLRHRNARTQRRNWIHYGTRNQWRLRRSGVMRSECLAENMKWRVATRGTWNSSEQRCSLLSIINSDSDDMPCAGSGVVRIDPLHFLTRCCTRRLNQA